MLHGILLVINGTRGHQLVFVHPLSPNAAAAPPLATSLSGRINQGYQSGNGAATPHSSSAQKMQYFEPVFGFSASVLADMLSPKPALCDNDFELSVEGLKFISHPIPLPSNAPTSGTTTRQRSLHSDDEMTLFNLVFVLPSECQDAPMYKRIAKLLAKALKHEQLRCGYVNTQVTLMLELQAQKYAEQMIASDNPEKSPCDLQNELIKLYNELTDTGMTHVCINHWIDLYFSLQDPERRRDYALRPYHSLLLLEPAEQLLESLPCDSNPNLARLIKQSNPMKSFQDIQIDMDIALHQLFRLASHLVYWRKATIIVMINTNNVYALNPAIELDFHAAPFSSFHQTFPNASLPELLAMFSVAKRLGDHVNSVEEYKRDALIQQVLWLLQHRLLIQFHTYLYHIPSRRPSGRPPPQHLQPLFAKLERYFSGQHHVEEIMWRENLPREHLMAVINAYSGSLMCCLRPAPDLSSLMIPS